MRDRRTWRDLPDLSLMSLSKLRGELRGRLRHLAITNDKLTRRDGMVLFAAVIALADRLEEIESRTERR